MIEEKGDDSCEREKEKRKEKKMNGTNWTRVFKRGRASRKINKIDKIVRPQFDVRG